MFQFHMHVFDILFFGAVNLLEYLSFDDVVVCLQLHLI